MTGEWVPGTPHPTGGYDRIELDAVSGAPKSYYRNDSLHRLDGPAHLTEILEEWWLDGVRHRDDGPAYLVRDSGGVIVREIYHRFGKISRLDGPAKVLRNSFSGADVLEEWCIEGERHRLDGPAYVSRTVYGEVSAESFYVRGEQWSAANFAMLRSALDSGAPLDWALAFLRGDAA